MKRNKPLALLLASLLGLCSGAEATNYVYRVASIGIMSAVAGPAVAPPGAVFATWDSSYSSSATFSNGDLDFAGTSGATWYTTLASQAKSSGKWYWEVTQAGGTGSLLVGIAPYFGKNIGTNLGATGTSSWSYWNLGYRVSNAVAGTSTDFSLGAPAVGDTYMLALDMDNHALYLGKNGVWALNGLPSSGAARTGAALFGFNGPMYPAASVQISQSSVDFGATAFKYPVPQGYNPGVYK